MVNWSLKHYLEYFSTFNLEGAENETQECVSQRQNSGSPTKDIRTPIKKQLFTEAVLKIQGNAQKVERITAESLAKGIFFDQLLSKISQMPAIEINRKPQTFADNFSNMKALYKRIEAFWQKELERQLNCQEIDFVEIAKNYNEEEIEKFCQLFIRTAFQAENQNEFIEKILKTSEQTQTHFKRIAQETIAQRISFSPRKLEKNRLLDKLFEMENENGQLEKVFHEICLEKKELEEKNLYINDRLTEKEKEIQKLHSIMGEFYSDTPQKKRNSLDLNDKQSQQIHKLEDRIIQVTKQYERQVSSQQHEIQSFSLKIDRLNELESIVEEYKDKISDAKAALSTVGTLQNAIRRNMKLLKDKDEEILDISVKLDKGKQRICELQEKEMEYRLDLERKTIQLQESLKFSEIRKTSSQDQSDFSAFQGLSIHRTLSELCPEIINNQTDNLQETNRSLRVELERAKKTIGTIQKDAKSQKADTDNYRKLEKQNKRLTTIIKDLVQHRGEENEFLTGCMYELRMASGVNLAKKKGKTDNSMIQNQSAYSLKRADKKVMGKVNVN